MTRRTALSLPLAVALNGETDEATAFFDPCREWIKQINLRVAANTGEHAISQREIAAYLSAREAWPRLKRAADRFYGV